MEQKPDDGEPWGRIVEDASLDIDRIRLALRDSYMRPFSYDPGLRRRLAEAVSHLSCDEPPTLAAELMQRVQALAEAPDGYSENGFINDALADAFLGVFATVDECAVPMEQIAGQSTILQ